MRVLAVCCLVALTTSACVSPGSLRVRLGDSQPAMSRLRRRLDVLPIGCVAVGGVLFGGLPGPLALAQVAGAVAALGFVGWLIRQRTHAARQRRLQLSAIALCDALAAELRAGLPALIALTRACRDDPNLAAVDRVAGLGGDVSAALRRAGDRPGGEGLCAIAVGWTVGASAGASLAAVLDRIGEGLRDRQEARAEIESALGPPRATARMLAVLPAFGVLLGSAMGARPLAFLLKTGAGNLCLAVGVALALTGVAWVERLAAAAEAA